MPRKKREPLHISLRKNRIYSRRQTTRKRGLSSMEEAHKILEEADPNFTKTVKISGEHLFGSKRKPSLSKRKHRLFSSPGLKKVPAKINVATLGINARETVAPAAGGGLGGIDLFQKGARKND